MSRNDSRVLLRVESLKGSVLLRNYPKEQAPLILEEETDVNGFNRHDRATLRNAWRLIEPQKRLIGRNAFYSFLTHYHDQIDHFRDENMEIKTESLHGHATRMMELLEGLITHLNSPSEFHQKLQMAMPIHVTKDIHQEFIVILTEEFKKTLFDSPRLSKHISPSLNNALNRLMSIVAKFNKNEEKRRQLSHIRYSLLKGETKQLTE